MRFFHKDVAPVLTALGQGTPVIQALEWELNPAMKSFFSLLGRETRRAARPATPATILDVMEMSRRKPPMRISEVFQLYFHINRTLALDPAALTSAIQHVESAGADDEYLLAGHPDGGLISVSRVRLPFQQGLDPITWWGGA
jgi:hypothetical protein